MRKLCTAALAICLIGAACSSGPETSAASALPPSIVSEIPSLFDAAPRQAEGTHVGRVGSSDAFVALVVQAGKLVGYVCDGTRGEWFGGDVGDGRIDVTTTDGTKIRATTAADAISGTLQRKGGPSQQFTATPPSGPGPGIFNATGLYRTAHRSGGKNYVGGWIVLPDGLRGISKSGDGSTTNGAAFDARNPGESVRSRIPGPHDEQTPRGLVEFAGQDANNAFRIGVVQDSSTNGMAGFVTNGADIGRWLTGALASDGSFTISNSSGDRLQGTLSQGKIAGQATVAARNLKVALSAVPAKAIGLRRAVQQTLDGKQIELGFVPLIDGTVSAAGLNGSEVAFKGHVAGSEPGSSEGTFAQESSDSARRVTLKFLRCAVLNLRFEQSHFRAGAGGNGSQEFATQEQLEQRYRQLGCEDDFGPIHV